MPFPIVAVLALAGTALGVWGKNNEANKAAAAQKEAGRQQGAAIQAARLSYIMDSKTQSMYLLVGVGLAVLLLIFFIKRR